MLFDVLYYRHSLVEKIIIVLFCIHSYVFCEYLNNNELYLYVLANSYVELKLCIIHVV